MIRVEMNLKQEMAQHAHHNEMYLGKHLVTATPQVFEVEEKDAQILVSEQAKYWMDVKLLEDAPVKKKVRRKKKVD